MKAAMSLFLTSLILISTAHARVLTRIENSKNHSQKIVITENNQRIFFFECLASACSPIGHKEGYSKKQLEARQKDLQAKMAGQAVVYAPAGFILVVATIASAGIVAGGVITAAEVAGMAAGAVGATASVGTVLAVDSFNPMFLDRAAKKLNMNIYDLNEVEFNYEKYKKELTFALTRGSLKEN